MNKKITIFVVMLALLMAPLVFGEQVYAKPGGLLDGKVMTIGPDINSATTTTTAATDNNTGTQASLSAAGVYVYYEFATPATIDSFYIEGSQYTYGDMKVRFYDASESIVYSFASSSTNTISAKTYSFAPIANVKKVAVYYSSSSASGKLIEFDVFGSAPEPTSDPLISGATMYIQTSGVLSGGTATQALTDGNFNTGATINAFSSANNAAYVRFDNPARIDAYTIRYTVGAYKVRFYDDSKTKIKEMDTGQRDGTTKNFLIPPLENVSYAEIVSYQVDPTVFHEFQLYGEGGGIDLPPAIPTGLTATPGDGQVSLSWTAVGDFDLAGYNLYRGGLKINGSLIAKPTTSYTDTGLTNGTPYSYQVTSVDAAGNESEKSAIVQAIPQGADTVPPSVPSGLLATPGDGQVSLSWTAVGDSDLTGYHVYMEGLRMTTTPVTETTRTITALTNGTDYNFQVSAVDTWGNESAKSSPVQATPQAAPVAPPKPTGLKANASNAKVVLKWEPVPSATKYIVYRDDAQLTETNGTTYTDTTVTNGVQYKYEVSAANDSGESPKIQAFAKPSEVPDLLETVLPFSVRDMIQTAINFLKLFPSWILLALGVLFASSLIYIAMKLTGNKQMQAPDRYKVGKDGKLEKVKAEKAGRQSQSREKDVIYRSTGERDKYGNRIRVTQDKYEKMTKKQSVGNELKERQRAEQKWERWKERERERIRERHEKRGDLAGRDRYLAAYERTFKEYESKTPRGQRKGR